MFSCSTANSDTSPDLASSFVKALSKLIKFVETCVFANVLILSNNAFGVSYGRASTFG